MEKIILEKREKVKHDEYAQINSWLEKYSGAYGKAKKNKYKALIITKMLPVVKRIARTIARRSYDPVDDLAQAGAIGVLRAIEHYSTNLGVEFRIYAGQLIIGEMKHFLRDKLKAIKVPRYVQELIYRINSFTDSLTRDELNDLTSYDIAMATSIPAQKIDFVLEVERRANVISIEELNSSGGGDGRHLTFEEVTPYDDYEEKADLEEIRLILDNVIKYLPEECKNIVELYYYKDMSQSNIAESLGLTQMTVSRRLKKAFDIMYEMIADSEMHREIDDGE